MTPSNETMTCVYDVSGIHPAMADPGGRVTIYTYDGDRQPMPAVHPGGATQNYDCDAAGRQATVTDGLGDIPAEICVYNNADQLLSENGNTYEYDLNGNLISKTDASGTTSYTWDYEDRLVSVSGPDGTVTYEYGVDGAKPPRLWNNRTC